MLVLFYLYISVVSPVLLFPLSFDLSFAFPFIFTFLFRRILYCTSQPGQPLNSFFKLANGKLQFCERTLLRQNIDRFLANLVWVLPRPALASPYLTTLASGTKPLPIT